MIETASDGGGALASRLTPSACLLCGASRYEVLLAYDRPDAYEMAAGVGGDGYARHWVRCAGCGFHYARYSRDPDVLDRIYVSAYRDEAAAWRRHSIEETFRRIVALPPEESETWARIDWIKAELRALAAADLGFARALLRATGNVAALAVLNTVGRVLEEVPDVAAAMYADIDGNLASMQRVLGALGEEPGVLGATVDEALSRIDGLTVARYLERLRARA